MTTIIGIVAQDQPDERFGVNTNYIEFASKFGRPVIILPESWEDFQKIYKLDALLLPGGSDVDTKRYSNYPMYGTYNPNVFLEWFDLNILPNLIDKMPIFGICRGLQTLNVHFGGTLRNLWLHPYSQYETDEAHKVRLKRNDKGSEFGVNSFHHQAISKLADGLVVQAESSDFIIEAIKHSSKKIAAVQWHPERLRDGFSINLFNSILE